MITGRGTETAAPLLVIGPVRSWAYVGSSAFELSFRTPLEHSVVDRLSVLEAGFTRALDPSDLPKLDFSDGLRTKPLLESAVRAGLLRVHSLVPESPCVELAGESGPRWADLFAVQRIFALPPGRELGADGWAGVPEEGPSRSAVPTRVLVFTNPSGEPALPMISEEGSRIFTSLSEASDLEVDWVGRPVSASELRHFSDAYDAVFYHGHGRLIDGETVIPVTEGWAPLTAGRGAGLLFFSACLDGGSGYVPRKPGLVVHPIVRIADRLAPFTTAFAAAFASQSGSIEARVIAALCAAGSADRAAGDIRRFVFRLASA